MGQRSRGGARVTADGDVARHGVPSLVVPAEGPAGFIKSK
ncbi:predicted protein [Streptomyces sp. SPB78]|nr:predicted protein [Streptomyces sp. SPB78]